MPVNGQVPVSVLTVKRSLYSSSVLLYSKSVLFRDSQWEILIKGLFLNKPGPEFISI